MYCHTTSVHECDIAHQVYDEAFTLQVNLIFMKQFTLNKEIYNFAIISFQMFKLPQSLHVLNII